MRSLLPLAVALLSMPTAATTQSPAPNWPTTLESDAKFLREELKANHPGYVDPLNPGFRSLVERGYKLALSRAKTADDFADYWWAMREYFSSFDDGHLNVGFTKASPAIPRSWPGFLTKSRNDTHRVVSRLAEETLPPSGAELVSCDGIAANTLAAQNVGRFWGRWQLASKREMESWRLFLDEQNPYIRRPTACIFRVEGKEQSYTLKWRQSPSEELSPHVQKASEAFRAPVDARWYGETGYWISFGTFGSGGGAQIQRLPMITGRIEREKEKLRKADIIVFDLRGNSGGGSDWSMRTARALWGEAWLDAKRPHFGDVDWRVSPTIIKDLQGHVDYYRKQNNPDMVAWTENQMKEMREALSAGRPFWHQKIPRPKNDPTARPETNAKIFVLTDAVCLSACLDALDIWKPLGAVHIGRETSADTFYIQVRQLEFPSNMAGFIIPQKVWRNRPRGSNEPHVPAHVFDGDMSDTAALEKWVSGLANATSEKPRPAG